MFENSLLANKYNGFIKQNKSFLIALVKIVDVFIICVFYIAFFGNEDYLDKQKLTVMFFTILAFEFFASLNSLYGIPRGARLLFIIKNIFSAWMGAVVIALPMSVFSGAFEENEMLLLLYWLGFTPFYLVIWRVSLRVFLVFLRKIGRNNQTVAIVGATRLGLDIENIISKQRWMGYSLVGFFDDREPGIEARSADINVIGNYDDLVEMAKSGKLDVVFITLPMASVHRIKKILDLLSDTSVMVYFIPDLFVFDLLGAKVENFNGLPAVCVYDTPHSGIDGISKRLFDIIVSLIILTIIAIPMLIIATGVKLSSPGPVLFIQRRYGFRGEEIQVWKFRSMRACEDGVVVTQASRGDPRVTKFGQFIRKTSLDELPQFINALQGRMSIVGPRPHAVAHNEFYRGRIRGYMLRHNVKPGITGLAQIKGFRGETDTLDKMEGRIHSDLEYIQNWSIWMDLEILVLTVLKGFLHKNAY
jgi:putative colanic acid biosysnthesis UDP-glucose lipid carrier transferase